MYNFLLWSVNRCTTILLLKYETITIVSWEYNTQSQGLAAYQMGKREETDLSYAWR